MGPAAAVVTAHALRCSKTLSANGAAGNNPCHDKDQLALCRMARPWLPSAGGPMESAGAMAPEAPGAVKAEFIIEGGGAIEPAGYAGPEGANEPAAYIPPIICPAGGCV